MNHARFVGNAARLLIGATAAIAIAGLGGPAASDTTAPGLTGFSFSPTFVDVQTSSAGVLCSMAVEDSPAGVAEATCELTSSFFFQQQSCVADTPVSGDRRSGTFECTVTLPQYADAGTWTASVRLQDSVGNERVLTQIDLAALLFPTDLTVTSLPDLVPPTLAAFDFNPKAVNVDGASASVTCDMTFTDSPSGVDEATCQFQSADFFRAVSCSSTVPASGTSTNGTYSCTASIPRYADGGIWQARVIVNDRVGNVNFYDTFFLQALTFPTDLTVTSTSEDVVEPTVVDFSFTPSAVDVSSAPQIVGCTIDVIDSPAGTQFAGCAFISPSEAQQQGCFSLTPDTGTPQNGTYVCDVVIPSYSEAGVWKAQVIAQDKALNLTGLLPADLAGAGLPTDLSVTCGGATEPWLRWDSKTLLAWDALTGAVRYNVYRGDLSLLAVDYGSCQNSRDGDLTDTGFDESDIPLAGEAFQFLVSMTGSGGEGGLGNYSGGIRSVSSPCP